MSLVNISRIVFSVLAVVSLIEVGLSLCAAIMWRARGHKEERDSIYAVPTLVMRTAALMTAVIALFLLRQNSGVPWAGVMVFVIAPVSVGPEMWFPGKVYDQARLVLGFLPPRRHQYLERPAVICVLRGIHVVICVLSLVGIVIAVCALSRFVH